MRNLEHSWPRSCLCMGFAGFPHSKTCPVSSPLCVPSRRTLRIVASFAGRGVPPAAVPAVAHTSLVGQPAVWAAPRAASSADAGLGPSLVGPYVPCLVFLDRGALRVRLGRRLPVRGCRRNVSGPALCASMAASGWINGADAYGCI